MQLGPRVRRSCRLEQAGRANQSEHDAHADGVLDAVHAVCLAGRASQQLASIVPHLQRRRPGKSFPQASSLRP